jgi:hypothetical protein
MQLSRAVYLTADEGSKLSERSEFLDPPQAITQVREVPIASGPKLRAAFLLLRFLWPAKKMKIYELGHFLVLTA